MRGMLEWQDKCLNSTQLQEGYCDPISSVGFKTFAFNCPSGCGEGICQKSLNLVSPSGNEIFKEGESYAVSWKSEGLDVQDEAVIVLRRSDGLEKQIARVPANQNYFRWKVETNFSEWDFLEKIKKEAKIKNYDLLGGTAFKYNIFINSVKSRAGDFSDSFIVIERPLADLELGEIKVDSGGFRIEVCNQGNKDLSEPEKSIRGAVTVYLPRQGEAEEKTIVKTLVFLGAQIAKDSCKESDFISYGDFGINQSREYKVKVDLDQRQDLDELYEPDIKEYQMLPQFGFYIRSPQAGARWGRGSRNRITVEATGPDVWTKIDISAINKNTGENYKIDSIHIKPPSIDYWWTIPSDIVLGEEYAIEVSASESFKKAESEKFAVIEPVFACNDSDNGKNYYQSGMVEGVFAAFKEAEEERNASDFCLADDILVEYICKYDYVYSEHYECPFGCSSGVCGKAIKILSPNDDTMLKEGDSYLIKWETLKYSQDSKIQIKLRDLRYKQNPVKEEIMIAEVPNTGSYNWTVPSSLDFTKADEAPNYKILVSVDGGGIEKSDESAKSIAIIKSGTKIAKTTPAPKPSPKTASASSIPKTSAPVTISKPPAINPVVPPLSPLPSLTSQLANFAQGLAGAIGKLGKLFGE